MWYSAKGRLNYNKNWLTLDCPQSIVDYYSWWVRRLTWKKGSTPYHKAHVTCVAGKYQDVSHHPCWGKYHGKIVEFKYSNVIQFEKQKDGTYYWLLVQCDFLKHVRLELGLDKTPKFPYHLTCYFIAN